MWIMRFRQENQILGRKWVSYWLLTYYRCKSIDLPFIWQYKIDMRIVCFSELYKIYFMKNKNIQNLKKLKLIGLECEINHLYCTKCTPTSYKHTINGNIQCVLVCPRGYWEKISGMTCEKCSANCKFIS